MSRSRSKNRTTEQRRICNDGRNPRSKGGKIHFSRQEYRNEYLKSPQWKIKRDIIIDKNPFCAFCPAKSWDVHHLTYERICFEWESDLCAVCRKCHNKIHYILGYTFKKNINIEETKKLIRRHDSYIGKKIILTKDICETFEKLDSHTRQRLAGFLKSHIEFYKLIDSTISKLNFVKMFYILSKSSLGYYENQYKKTKPKKWGGKDLEKSKWSRRITEKEWMAPIRRLWHLFRKQ